MAENKVDLLLVGKADFSDVTKKLMQLKKKKPQNSEHS